MPVNALTFASSGVLSIARLICPSESRNRRAVIKAARSGPTERDNCSTCLLSRWSSPTQSPACTQWPSLHCTSCPWWRLTTSLHIPYWDTDTLRNLVNKSNTLSHIIQIDCKHTFEVDANTFNTVTYFPSKICSTPSLLLLIVENEILFSLTPFLQIS